MFGDQIARAAEYAQPVKFHPEKIPPKRGNGKRGKSVDTGGRIKYY
jgi:hypothetical protein